MCTEALKWGLTATIPAYPSYSYSKIGRGLFKAFRELYPVKQVFVDTKDADAIASKIVHKAQQNGLLKEIAEKMKIKEIVFEELLNGSISSALSTGAGELTRLIGGKANSKRMEHKEIKVILIVVARKAEFYVNTEAKLFTLLPYNVDEKANIALLGRIILLLRHVIAKLDNKLFISEEEKASKTIDPSLSVSKLRLNKQGIINVTIKAMVIC